MGDHGLMEWSLSLMDLSGKLARRVLYFSG